METQDYQRLLLAVDFERESEPVIARAQRLRDLMNARLFLLHVVEHIPPSMDYVPVGYAGGVAAPDTLELEEELLTMAQRELDLLGARLDVPSRDRFVRVGPTARTIDEATTDLNIDLVVIGSRGRHGFLGLFGSSARAVLRNSTCDVLCVKIDEPD
ncbi:universal stress protein UspA [Thiocapsa imhoffii]|uniref:Universal stress protein n=1 Tax=Thiocapsa imhoffii TaxID=382777 RepID=A0A9X0WJF7_9GAMM|nr:universal stress protein [Thiocapsa imhoffii]MBK1645429.1 universal stress protein UspA [Thiocapsa imhoffii]